MSAVSCGLFELLCPGAASASYALCSVVMGFLIKNVKHIISAPGGVTMPRCRLFSDGSQSRRESEPASVSIASHQEPSVLGLPQSPGSPGKTDLNRKQSLAVSSSVRRLSQHCVQGVHSQETGRPPVTWALALDQPVLHKHGSSLCI